MSQPTISTEFITFSESATRYLADRHLALLGWDYLLLDSNNIRDFSATDQFLQVQSPILMGIQLQHIAVGEYQLSCLPLKLNTPLLPARAILSQ